MPRSGKLIITALLTVGLATAAFAGVAAAGELSKKQYLKQGNAICKDANDQIDAIFNEAFSGFDQNEEPSPDDPAVQAAIEDAVSQAAPIFRQALDDIDDLGGPASLEKKVHKLTDEYRAVVDDVEADPVAVLTSDEDPFAKTDKKATKLGLKECASDD